MQPPAADLYRDALSEDSSWSNDTLKKLGHSNTYTFAKAVCEHLVRERSSCASRSQFTYDLGEVDL